MNGWQRLWVLACVVWAVVPVVFYVQAIPSDQKLNHAHRQQIVRLNADLKLVEHPSPEDNKIIYNALIQTSPEERKAYIAEVEAQHAAFMNTLPGKRVKTAATLTAIWAGGCVVLYLLGLAIRWVIRGFRPKKD